MNKLALVIMAALCTMMISCSEQELESSLDLETQIASRSISNPIQVVATSSAGNATTYSCTQATFSYQNALVALDMLVDDSIVSITTATVSLNVSSEYTLAVSIDENNSFLSDNLSVEVCGSELCYENISGTQIGTALDFIVEDETVGM